MLELALFVLLTVVGILAAVAVLSQKSLFKSAIALAILFAVVSGYILMLGQTLISLFQLLILVGGLSTYLVVAVAAEGTINFRHVSARGFSVIFVVLAAVLIYATAMNSNASFISAPDISQEIALAIGGSFGIIAAVVFLMFAVGIGSVMLIKKAIKTVV
ncbi:MAG: hypothetical protein KGH65_00675 [Candidatus Micrarchaeota archaeon]|nr:hypothetical protein [Candidatus Micrarchaeota archaeon]